MASDIAARIRARFKKRRHSTIPSLPSSGSGLGESLDFTGPSHSSFDASLTSHTQPSNSQTSDEPGEATGRHTNGRRQSLLRKKARKNEKGQGQSSTCNASSPRDEQLQVRDVPRAGGANGEGESDDEDDESCESCESPGHETHRHSQVAGTIAGTAIEQSYDQCQPRPPGPPPLFGPLDQLPMVLPVLPAALDSLVPAFVQSPIPAYSSDAQAAPAPSPTAATSLQEPQDPHSQSAGQSRRPPSRSQAQPAQPSNRSWSAHLSLPLSPPSSETTPSPTSSPRPPLSETIHPTSSAFPQPGTARASALGLGSEADADSSRAAAASAAPGTAFTSATPRVDHGAASHHGREPERLSFSSIPAVAQASAASLAHNPSSSVANPEQQSPRRQSLFASRQTGLIRSLLRSSRPLSTADLESRLSFDTNMVVTRKIWVKRPHASATTITINEDDLVDDVRDMILRKYANSLGRHFDSPDLVIRLHPRDHERERMLGPEETMTRALDAHYPGGQSVDEALTIDIPRRTPKASPRAPMPPGTAAATTTTYYVTDDGRPSEAGEGYFPPVTGMPSPRPAHSVPAIPNGAMSHSIAVIGTGQLPLIPSPGATRTTRVHRERSERPRLSRTHTASPTILAAHPVSQPSNHGGHSAQGVIPRLPHSRTHSSSSDRAIVLPTVKASVAKSPGPEPTPTRVATPPPRSSSPRAPMARSKRAKKVLDYSSPSNMLNGSVPPINVLIVEDNPINLKLLEAFVKRLKVRWQTAMNGRDAVKKWRTGGFHLVLMDIQLPVMNGLDATREIRRLERVNSIGVFSSAPESGPDAEDNELKEQDRLQNLTLFKSPVIIVALTASSLQSDRHEALAAGCNDFLTKPVNFVWLERKVMEWGCMQALIDFDGWRRWKEAWSQQNDEREAAKKGPAAKGKSKKSRSSTGVAVS